MKISFALLFGIFLFLLLAYSLVSEYGGVKLFQVPKIEWIEIPCKSLEQCKAWMRAEGLTEAQIEQLGLRCEAQKCFIKGFTTIEKVKVRK